MPVVLPSIPEPGSDPQSQLITLRAVKQVVDLIAANATGSKSTFGPNAGAQIFALQSDVEKLIKQATAAQTAANDKSVKDINNAVDEAVSQLNADIDYARLLAIKAREDALKLFKDLQDATDKALGDLNTALGTLDGAFNEADGILKDAISRLDGVVKTVSEVKATADDAGASVKREEGARASADTAIAGRIDTVNAYVGLNEATWIDKTVSLATRFESVVGKVTTYQSKYDDTYFANVTNSISAITKSDGAIATAVNKLETKITDPVAGPIASAVNTEQISRSKADQALAGRIDTTAAYMGLNEATWIDRSVSLATKFEALTGKVNTYQTKYDDTYFSNVTTSITAITKPDGSIATAVNNLETKINDPNVAGTLAAKLQTEATTRTTNDNTLSGRIDKAAAYMGLNEATWSVGQASIATKFGALSTNYNTLTAKYGGQPGNTKDFYAVIDSLLVASVNATTGAVTSKIDTLQNYITIPSTAGRPADLLSSAILTEQNSVTDATKKFATAQSVNTTIASLSQQAGVNGATTDGAITAAVKVESDARVALVNSNGTGSVDKRVDNIKSTAAYSLTVATTGVNPAITGFRAVSDSSTNTPISDFTIYSSTFKITNGATTKQVFSVDTVNSKINMTADVAIDGNLFVTGSINARPIAGNAISDNQSYVGINTNSAAIYNMSLTVGDRVTIIGTGAGNATAGGVGSTASITVYYANASVPAGAPVGSTQTITALCESGTVGYNGSSYFFVGSYKFPPTSIIRTFTATVTGPHNFSVLQTTGGDTGIAVIRLSR